MNTQFIQSIQDCLPEITALRRKFHTHPELRFNERKTSERIQTFLSDHNIDFQAGFAKGTGIVATIPGTGDGPTILLRSDMDALEIEEQTGLPYSSEVPGCMHACGHDGHMALLCGVARVLSQHRNAFNGVVKCVFQPAEEEAAGGRYIVEEGVLNDVDVAFALHAWPSLPVGKIAVEEGFFMAGAEFFQIDIQGKGGHGADPARTVDPIPVAAHIVTALQSVLSRELNPWDAGVITVAQMTAGQTSNIIPESALLKGTLRAITPDIQATLRDSLSRIATSTAAAHRATAHVLISENHYPPLYNHPDVCQYIRSTAENVLEKESVCSIPHPLMTAEDFAYYLQKVPGALLLLGVSKDVSQSAQLHSPYFDFNDDTLPVGMALLMELVCQYASWQS